VGMNRRQDATGYSQDERQGRQLRGHQDEHQERQGLRRVRHQDDRDRPDDHQGHRDDQRPLEHLDEANRQAEAESDDRTRSPDDLEVVGLAYQSVTSMRRRQQQQRRRVRAQDSAMAATQPGAPPAVSRQVHSPVQQPHRPNPLQDVQRRADPQEQLQLPQEQPAFETPRLEVPGEVPPQQAEAASDDSRK
jgi:hypothetical protein